METAYLSQLLAAQFAMRA